MTLGTILLIVLILLLIGALPSWPYSSGWGYYPSGGLGVVVVILRRRDAAARLQRMAVDDRSGQRGDDEARVRPLLQVLGLAHHASLVAPALAGAIREVLEHPAGAARRFKGLFRLLQFAAEDLLHHPGEDPELPEHALHAEGARFVGHDRHDEIADLQGMTNALNKRKPGDTVRVTVLRDGAEVVLTAVLGKR